MILVIITLMVACGSIYFLFLKHEQGTPESIASAQELRQPKNSLVGTTTMNSNGVSGGTLHTASPTLWVNKGKILPWNYVASDTEMILTADPSFNWSTFPPLVKYYDDQSVIVGYPSVKAC